MIDFDRTQASWELEQELAEERRRERIEQENRKMVKDFVNREVIDGLRLVNNRGRYSKWDGCDLCGSRCVTLYYADGMVKGKTVESYEFCGDCMSILSDWEGSVVV